MLDKSDLQAIAEMIVASEQRMIAAMDEKQVRMEAFVTGKIESSEQRTAQRIAASEARLRNYIDDRSKEAESHAVAFAENEVQRKQGVIVEGIDLSLQVPRVPFERVERTEQNVAALQFVVKQLSAEVEALKRGA